MTISQLFTILLSRWRLVLAMTLTVGLLGLGVSLAMPKKYTATASLLVDIKGVDPVQSSERGQIVNQTVMTTQADLMTSERVALRVVEMLNLTQSDEYREAWEDDADSRGEFASFIAQLLLRNIEVRPSKDSSVLDVSFTSRSAPFAAQVANAFIKAHMDTSLEMRVEPARQFSGWFDERTKQLRERVEAAQAKLAAYQREKGVLAVAQGQIDVENAKLAGLTQQLIEIQALRAESRSRQSQANRSLDESPDVVNSPVIATLRTEVAKAEVYLRQLSRHLGSAHPDVDRANQNLQSLRAELRSEMRSIARTVGGSDTVNQRREAEVRAAVETQRQRVLAMTSNSSEMAVLTRDLESAQRAFDAASNRQWQTSLESQMQQTNVFSLTTASEPPLPASPRIKLNTAAATVLGALLGMGLALLMEARTPKVRSLEDLVAVTALPVLAVVSRASNSPAVPGKSAVGLRYATQLLKG